jgi:hypothetical protein
MKSASHRWEVEKSLTVEATERGIDVAIREVPLKNDE